MAEGHVRQWTRVLALRSQPEEPGGGVVHSSYVYVALGRGGLAAGDECVGQAYPGYLRMRVRPGGDILPDAIESGSQHRLMAALQVILRRGAFS